MKEICEVAAEYVTRKTGTPTTGEQVWMASPTGELWHVFQLYEMAMQDQARQETKVLE